MTHTRSYDDSEGEFSGWHDASVHDIRCPLCDSPRVQYRTWESSDGGYEDYQYRCAQCLRVWWVDGIDS